MLFHLFCEFADGSSKYLHLRSSSEIEAHREAIRTHSASVVLLIVNSLDPACRLLGLEFAPQKFAANRIQHIES